MYFLIDFENVRNLGLRGSEYLHAMDHLIVFYSKSASQIQARHMQNIQRAGCRFEACKLLIQRKNGLDFYIATRIGQIFGKDQTTRAVVVSNDNGFHALRDFWQVRSESACRIALAESIEQGILSISEQSPRAEHIREALKTGSIGQFYTAWQAEQRRRQALTAAFGGGEYEKELSRIQDRLPPTLSPRALYLEALRCFGRQDGQRIYKTLKTVYADLARPQGHGGKKA